jgi:hypothetical protein
LAPNPFEKVKSETRLLEKIMMAIPGFRGYKLRELRRESDRLIRNQLHHRLTTSIDDLKTIYQRLVDNRLTDVWKDMDRLVARLETVSEAINHASYGYSGFFDAVKIQEARLDVMLDYDSRMLEDVERIGSAVEAYNADVLNGDFADTRTHIQAVGAAVDQLDAVYGERRNAILGV